MKKIFISWGNLTRKLSCKQFIAVLAIVLVLAPVSAQAIGLGDIVSLIKTITGTLQDAVGGMLSEIQGVQTTINNYRQQIIWPLNELNEVRGFVSATEGSILGLDIPNPEHQEQQRKSGKSQTTGVSAPWRTGWRNRSVPAVIHPSLCDRAGGNTAWPIHRDMMDIDDALALDALKTTVVSDQTTAQLLALADSLEQQSASAAPGSAPLLTAQARVTDLVAQAQMAKMLAAELRQEAAKLAHQNTLLKQSATATRNLQNQMQQVLKHPVGDANEITSAVVGASQKCFLLGTRFGGSARDPAEQSARSQLGLDPCCAIISADLDTISGFVEERRSQLTGVHPANQQQASDFERQVVWPATAINQARALAVQAQGQFTQMRQVFQIPVSSATLPTPQQLEQSLLSLNPGAVGQITSKDPALYGPVVAQTDAPYRFAIWSITPRCRAGRDEEGGRN